MENIILYLLISTPVLLSGCVGERLISTSNDYYTQGNDMVCVNHSSDVESGAMIGMSNDIDNLILSRETPRKSCAIFSYENNKITTTSVNNNKIEIKPYRKYNFHTDIIKKDGSADNASGLGPSFCFTKDEKDNFILQLENFGDYSQYLNNLDCR